MKNFTVRFFQLGLFAVVAVGAEAAPLAPGADFRAMTPEKVCAILSDQGLQVMRYSAGNGEQIYRGSSYVKSIGVGDPMKNTLAFFLVGESSHVTKLELVLSINSPEDRTNALEEFCRVTSELLDYCGDNRHADKIAENIRLEKSGIWSTERGGIVLKRIDRANGDCYEMRVTVL